MRPRTRLARGALAGALVAFLRTGATGAAGSADAEPSAYVGPAACAAPNCHGSVSARADSRTSLQNEFVTWHQRDRHAKAYESLLTDRGLAIARLVGMVDHSATRATWIDGARRPERCLDCHAVNVPVAERGPKFRLDDGVSCEACHGPAGAWLAGHSERDWTPARSLERGMRDTMDPATAAETCLACHLGTRTRRVDHELLAAGHPPLVFELDTFAANMPVHWKEHEGNRAWFRGGAWAMGQATLVRAAATHLGRQASEGGWPDFAAFECGACHHDLKQPSWRQSRGYAGRTPGTPPVDPARVAVGEVAARTLAPGESPALRSAIAEVERLLGEGRPARDVTPAADRAAAAAGQVVVGARGGALDEAAVRSLFHEIARAAEPLAHAGFRTAQQVAWALDALAVARAELAGRAVSPDDPLRRAIAPLFEELKNPAAYDPDRFARRVAALGRAADQ